MGKLKPEEVQNLPSTGKYGLLKEMYESGGGWQNVHQITAGGKERNWNRTKKNLEELREEEKVEKDYRRVLKQIPIYRPDASSYDLNIVLNLHSDLRTFVHEARTIFREARFRFRITCPNCGHSQKISRLQAWRRFLGCPRCGFPSLLLEYPQIFSEGSNVR
jgi:predicted RNA-binding Zn-ribbon protein involved in translation (DUF1610 family)